jgi:phosphoglycerate dehydrogenase-like enzyme
MNILVYIAWAVRAWAIPEKQVDVLRRRFPEITFIHEVHEAGALRSIADVDVSFSSRLNPAMVANAKRLRWVHSSAAAVEGLLPLAELGKRDIIVTNSRGIQAVPIAEQVMAGLLVLARRMDLTMAAQREKRWIQAQLCDSDWPWMLHGKSMTILGLGTIGLEVARRAHAFGIRVTGVKRLLDEAKPAFVDRVVGPESLSESMRNCDILVISAPFVAQTKELIGASEIAKMNHGAILVNIARSQIVNQTAMIEALESGQLGGAVLDVFDQEPLAAESPLWSQPHVIISPHSSGFRASHWEEVIDLFSDNLRRFQRGEPLLNLVDCAAGY